MLLGPQKARDRLWMGKEETIIIGERDDLKLERAAENQVYESEIAHLARENASIKDQLHRSLKELKAYQVKFPSAYVSVAEDEEGIQDLIVFSNQILSFSV